MKNFINGKRIKLEATIKKGINKNKYPSLNKKLYNLFSKFIKKNVHLIFLINIQQEIILANSKQSKTV